MKNHNFGFKNLSNDEKETQVHHVFSSVASKYDVMNDAMSFGIHRIWKKHYIDLAAIQKGETVVDISTGTGDLLPKIDKKLVGEGNILAVDPNPSMLQQAKKKCAQINLSTNYNLIQAPAEKIPIANACADCVLCSFGLRNMTDKQQALDETYRILRYGGRLLILEFSQVVSPTLARLYDLYSFALLPKLGKWLVSDEDSYRYLAESIRVHPDQETLATHMKKAKFDAIEYFNILGGIVAVHRGYKN